MPEKTLFSFFKKGERKSSSTSGLIVKDKKSSVLKETTPRKVLSCIKNTETSPKVLEPEYDVLRRNKKRRRVFMDSDEDSCENQQKIVKNKESDCLDLSTFKYTESPVKNIPKLGNNYNYNTNNSIKHEALNLSQFTYKKSNDALYNSPEKEKKEFKNIKNFSNTDEKEHFKLDFLKEKHLLDANKKPKSDPDYDPTTLYVPAHFLTKLSPTNIQWWTYKSKYFDSVLFFKIGKFYELLHMDAIIGVKELNLSLMRGTYAHAGFPEMSFGRFAETLIIRGYKVVRIEQTETPDMMNARLKVTKDKSKKCVNREAVQVLSLGTRVASVYTPVSQYGAKSNYLMSICESSPDESHIFGVCCVDTSIGHVRVFSFKDDKQNSILRTIISKYPPTHILLEKSKLSNSIIMLKKTCLSSCIIERLKKDEEFLSLEKTIAAFDGQLYWKQQPQFIKQHLTYSDQDNELGMRALGAVNFYLKKSFIDQDVFSGASFELVNMDGFSNSSTDMKNMIIDSVTFKNLELFVNSQGTETATLYNLMNSCCTKFGQRLLQTWIACPLFDTRIISDRLDAIDELMENSHAFIELERLLTSLPDIDRLLSRINSYGLKRSKDHPDNRAILFSKKLYTSRKIKELVSVIGGLETTLRISQIMKSIVNHDSCDFLKRMFYTGESCEKSCEEFTNDEGCLFPDMQSKLAFFKSSFNHERACETGIIVPEKGLNPEYDDYSFECDRIMMDIENYRCSVEKEYKTKVKFFSSGKTKYQMDISEKINVPSTFKCVGSKKGFRRYYTEDLKLLISDLEKAERNRDLSLQDTLKLTFSRFYSNAHLWKVAIECISVLDVILSFTKLSSQDYFSRPIVVKCTEEKDHKCVMHIEEGRHAYLLDKCDFIPNDTVININNNCDSNNTFLMLTGPNMGGKSTLMRQVGLLAIMAQMGCYVPAKFYRACAVDRIFTRLGASDRILSGESTFFVEMSETASIMEHAKSNSLVILDELGRGTSTFDGISIAYGVVHKLRQINCRTLFSTHYHSLIQDLENDLEISQCHMSFVKNDTEGNSITFLYKLKKGSCDSSYGFNSARLAGLPQKLIENARQRSIKFEKQRDAILSMHLVKRVLDGEKDSASKLCKLLSKMNIEAC